MAKLISRLSIRTKILSSSIITLLSISIFIFIYYPYSERKEINFSMQQKTHSIAEMVAVGVGVGMKLSSFELVTEAINWAKKDPDLNLIMAVDENGEVFASYNPSNLELGIQYLLANDDIVEYNGKAFHIAKVPIKYQNSFYGTIIMVSSLEGHYKLINKKLFITLIVSLSILVFGIILSFIFSKTITKPLGKLQHAVNKIAEGNYDVDIEVLSGDEISVLGRNFNVMAGKIKLLISQLESEIKVSNQAKAALSISEERYHTIIETAHDIIWTLDTQGNFTFINSRGEELTGHKISDLIGNSFVPLIYPDDLPKVQEVFSQTLQGKPQYYEVRIYDCGGKIMILSVNTVPLYEKDSVIGTVSFGRDVTEQKRMVETLIQSEQSFKSLVSTVEGIVWEADAKTLQFYFVSQQAERLLGYPTENWLTDITFWENHIHPDDREWAINLCITATKDKRDHDFEYRMIAADGHTVWLRDIVAVIVENNLPVRLRGIMVDITERKKADEELHRRNQELSVLHTIDRAVNQTLDLNQILNVAVEKTMEILDADSGGIYLFEEDSKTMKFVVHRGLSDEFVKNVETIQLGEGISGLAAAERRPIIIDVPHYPSKRLAPFIIKEGVQSLVSVPLLAKNRVLGAINVGSRKPDAFPENKIDTLLSIGIQIGVAIQNAELLITEKQKTLQLQAINRISQDIAGLMDVERLLSRVVKLIHEIFGYSYITLAVVDEKTNEIVYKAAAGYNIAELKECSEKLVGKGIIEWVAQSGEHLLANDVSKEPRFLYCDVLKHSRSELALPIILRNKVAAVLDIQSDKLNAFSSGDLSTFETMVYDISVALENAQLYEELRGTTNYLESLITYANAPIIVWNLERKITIFNHAFEKLSGYSSSEVINCGLEILFLPADKEEIFKTIDQAIKGERWESVEIPIQRKDGERRIALWNSASIIDKDGNIVATIAQGQDITERKQAEQQVKTLMEGMPDGVLVVNSQGTIIVANTHAEVMFGYKLEEILDKSIEMLLPARSREKHSWYRQMFIANPKTRQMNTGQNYFALRRDGSEFPVDISLSTVETSDGIAVISIVRDITERKQAEKILRESEEQMSTLLGASTDAIFLKDGEGRWLLINNSAAELFDLQGKEYRGKTDLQLGEIVPFHKEALAHCSSTDEDTWQTKNSSRSEETIPQQNSSPRIFDVVKVPLFEKEGRRRALVVVGRDITERKYAEEEIIFQKNRFSQLFENSPIAIVLLDDQYKIIHINESFSALFGYYLEEVMGKSVDDIIVPPELKEEAKSYSDQTSEGNQINKESYRKKKDGSNIFVQVIGVPVSVNDTTVGIYGMYVDLTQRKDAENKMRIAKELAEQSDRMKSEFLAQMSHEIRTPINIMIGNIDYLSQSFSENMDSEVRDCFDGIDLASKRIIRTIDLILNIAELQTGGYKPKFIKINLNSEILNKLYLEHQLAARQKGLELIYKCKLKETKILADEYSITQIFANLIDNAIKYTKSGKVEILLAKNRSGNVMIEIKDTGIGMSKEFLPRMFEPFVQEEQGYSRSYEGNGLGLALTKKYCEINNADIKVESEKNVGSTFRVIFRK